jgi:molybdopterin-binding protein
MSVVRRGHPIAVILLLSRQIDAAPAVAFVDLDESGMDPAFTYQHEQQIRSSGLESPVMPHYRIAQAASLLGVSDDTVRRWIDSGRLRASSASGPTTLDGAELAAHAQEIATAPELGSPVAESARNRFTGLVTRVIKDSVMAQVDLQCGPFRVVSLMSAEAASELQLEPGVLAVASVKSTHVVVEVPKDL